MVHTHEVVGANPAPATTHALLAETADATGKRLSLAELMPVLSESQLRPLQQGGWRVLPNTREELFAMADMMHRETSGAWREQPPEQRPIPTPLVWPMRPHQREKYVEF